MSAAREADTRAAIDDELRRLVESVANGLDGDALAGSGVQQAPDRRRRADEIAPSTCFVPTSTCSPGVPPCYHTRRAVQAAIDALTPRPTPGELADDEGLAWLAHTAGRRAVIVGGELRPRRIDALQRAFRFWSPSSDCDLRGSCRVQSLVRA
ncbi:MAG: hypothetical protein H6674_11245 [Dehalococcoidia bacterium]|nr:hypothetical protein [Dehalococcoidia bacterium]